jgi:hypothetical protein
MKTSEVMVKKTYTDGKTERTVQMISDSGLKVMYESGCHIGVCLLTTFCQWAKREVL